MFLNHASHEMDTTLWTGKQERLRGDYQLLLLDNWWKQLVLYDKFTVIKREKLTNAKQRTSKLHVIKVVDNNMMLIY